MPRSSSYARLLRDVSGSLATADRQRPAADVVLPLVREAFGAGVATLSRLVSPATLRVAGASGLEDRPALLQTWEQFDVSAGVPVAEAARTGRPVWLEDVRDHTADYPGWPASSPSRGVCAVPLHSAGRLVGVLGMSWTSVRAFTDVEKDTLLTVASILGAACQLDVRAQRRRLGVIDTDTSRDDVHLAHLVRSADTAVPRTVGTVAAHGAPTLSWLVEAPDDPALGVACEGVLGLARRQGTPPGIAARNVADLCQEMDGDANGVVLQVGPDAGWIAVAGINDCLVLSAPVMAGPEVTAFSGATTPADEHVIVPDGEGASVLALLLARGLRSSEAARLVGIAQAEFERRRGASAEDLLQRVGERLGEHGADGGLLGALALVVSPRPEVVTLRRTLPARPLAVPLARRFALAALGPAPDPEMAFRLGVAVDELVANAIRHCEDTVELAVEPGPERVRVEVDDDDDRAPRAFDDDAGPTEAASDQDGDPAGEQDDEPVAELKESGRGLVLLRAVADAHGVRARPRGGKSVWAELHR